MNKLQLTGAVLAVGAAALFTAVPAFAADAAVDAAMVKCVGGNACKGKSACKTADNACKGQNSCKGKGMEMKKSEKECTEAGGKVSS